MSNSLRLIFTVFIFYTALTVNAQGLYTEFGENRVTVREIQWEKISYKGIEVLYEKGNEELAKRVFEKLMEEIPPMEKFLQYYLRTGLQCVLYTNYLDYKNSNFSIFNEEFTSSGNVYAPENRFYVYFNGKHKDLSIQLKRGVATILVNELLYGSNIQQRARARVTMNIPDWFSEGVVNYMAESWNTTNDNLMRDAMVTGRFKNFNSLDKDDIGLAGHSIWYYIEQVHGKETIGNILFFTRVTRSVAKAISYYTGRNVNRLLKEHNNFYAKKFELEKDRFYDPKGEEKVFGNIANRTHTQFDMSEDGKKIAFVTNQKGLYKVYIYDVGKRKWNMIEKGGLKSFSGIPNYNFPMISWTGKNNTLGVVNEYNGKIKLVERNINNPGAKSTEIALDNFDWIVDFCYSPDGESIVFSAVKKGQSDLYLYDRATRIFKQLTNDEFDDVEPSFTVNGNLIFSSNRYNELKIGTSQLFESYTGIYHYEISSGEVTEILPSNNKIQFKLPQDMGGSQIGFLSDLNGIFNNYFVTINESGERISELKQLTNFTRSILAQNVSVSTGQISELVFIDGQYKIYISPYSEDLFKDIIDNKSSVSNYRITNPVDINQIVKQEGKIEEVIIDESEILDDSLTLDTIPDIPDFQVPFPIIDYVDHTITGKEKAKVILENKNYDFEPNVSTQFDLEYMTSIMFDNSILNDYYFPINTSSSVIQTALFSPRFGVSIKDIFKDHVLEFDARLAGSRFLSMFDGSDYSLRYINRKKRLDKQLSFWRRTRVDTLGIRFSKMISQQLEGAVAYPFSPRSKVQAGILLRSDQVNILSIDRETLNSPGSDWVTQGLNLSYVYDNTISRGMNLMQGFKFKAFAENYLAVNQKGHNLMLGFDMRHYYRIYKQLTWANRLVFNTSMGSAKTLYSLGGPENWIYGQYIDSFGYPDKSEYMFRTLGAPVRGFQRNVRMGSTYAVLNSELRLPLISFLYQKPIEQAFFRNFMLVGFVDAGSAWVGMNPNNPNNPYNEIRYSYPAYDITVRAVRNPLIMGMGWGLRTTVMGHYVKYDMAWGKKENDPLVRFHSFTLGMDF
jgi:hypothetical protein